MAVFSIQPDLWLHNNTCSTKVLVSYISHSIVRSNQILVESELQTPPLRYHNCYGWGAAVYFCFMLTPYNEILFKYKRSATIRSNMSKPNNSIHLLPVCVVSLFLVRELSFKRTYFVMNITPRCYKWINTSNILKWKYIFPKILHLIYIWLILYKLIVDLFLFREGHPPSNSINWISFVQLSVYVECHAELGNCQQDIHTVWISSIKKSITVSRQISCELYKTTL